ncbi:hypothetical protein CCHR01_15809 [Colletotrichum chrysophilum]|uniref:Uncharacterized protein n=1 Tax=Colletotrichum chrysophilum TaxID=1836956 RepID=A0AAD9EAN0_9PEZI|nr:hypothetical protein CCHR01_15809 [Colletotrichum chrysophilum]
MLRYVIRWISPEQAVAVDDAPRAFPTIAAVQLQRRVLDHIRDNLAEFRAPELLPLLDDDVVAEGRDGDNSGSYGHRFNNVTWARLLKLVRQSTDRKGHTLRPFGDDDKDGDDDDKDGNDDAQDVA